MNERAERQPFVWRKALTRLAVNLTIAAIVAGANFGVLTLWWALGMSGMAGAK